MGSAGQGCGVRIHMQKFSFLYLDPQRPVLLIRYVYPGSWILIFVHPGSRISDLRSRIQKQQQKRGVKKNLLFYLFCSHKNHKIDKIENYINFELVEKKTWANLQRIIELCTQKIFIKLPKIWAWDRGRDPEKTYSGSRIQGSKRHRISNPQQCQRHKYR